MVEMAHERLPILITQDLDQISLTFLKAKSDVPV